MLNQFPGTFIVFEGADDLGKSTQIEMVYQYFLDKGMKVIKTREPGGTKVGSKIRELLLESGEKLPKEAEVLLFMADRNIHYNQVIKPHLEQGYIVLCDRFHLSTLVYQGKLKGNNEEWLQNLHDDITDDLWPDKTFVFHGKRLTETVKDAYEANLGNKSHAILNNYYYEYGEFFSSHILIDANREKMVIFNEIITGIERA